jgi:hypothetical protein
MRDDGPTGPVTRVEKGDRVFVEVEGGSTQHQEDFASMLTAYLQSDRGLSTADEPEDADYIIRVRIDDVFTKEMKSASPGVGRTFGSTATGALLGMALGSLGGRRGAIVGAGIGAAAGLGVALADAEGKLQVWAMDVSYGIWRSDEDIRDKDMQQTTVSAAVQVDRGREEALPALDDSFCQHLLSVIRN